MRPIAPQMILTSRTLLSLGRLTAIIVLALTAPLRAGEPAPATRPVPLYKNPALPYAQRAADLVGRLTLQEKAEQIQMFVDENERLGIPACNWWSEAVHGVARAGKATVFPQALGMAATWDPPLFHQVAAAIADEARAKFNRNGKRYFGLMIWAPVVNMARDPRWGRAQETYGEDPCLTSRLAVEFVKGLQGDDPKYLKTVATPKHFAMHSQETGRTGSSFDISERTLREYYLPAFYDCFTEGHAYSTMAAHNGINKVPCTANTWLLTDLLRGEWGFDGAIVTDWSADTYLWQSHHFVNTDEEAIAASVKAGIDVLCNEHPIVSNVVTAVNKGLLSPKELDQALVRNITLRMRVGLFDPPEMVPFARTPMSVVGSKEHIALALQTARESLVLLQNDPAPPGYGFERILPLDLRRIHSIAVLGPYADTLQFGNYNGIPANPPVTVLQGLQAAVGDRVQVLTAEWGDDEQAVKVAQSCDVAIVVLGINDRLESEGLDRQTLELPPNQRRLLRKVIQANPVTVVLLEGGSPLALTWIKEHVPAFLMIWYPGEQGGNAVAQTLLGRNNPSGRLPMTFYRDLADLPPLNDYEIDKGRTYMYLQKPAPFVFGHGLSYTTFAYSNLHVDPPAPGAATATLSLDVANTGSRNGDEVVQLYVRKDPSVVKRPLKKLAAFQRISIPAGESRPVHLVLKLGDLAYWDTPTHKFIVEPGPYEIMLGASSADIRLRGSLELK